MTTQTMQRRIEDICPTWCAGHKGGYQCWDDHEDGQTRDHAERGTAVGNATVMLIQVESEDHSLSDPIVEVYVDEVADLTPAQACELAQVLVSAAERAEAQR